VDDDLLRTTMGRIGVEFDWTVTAERTRSYKPAPGHFLAALDRLGGTERLLHVASSFYHDVAPALTLGISVVWVNRNAEPVSDEPIPDHVVADLNELAAWLGV
jgi:FMN phosphatase YigB (HAD superfamily)